MNVSCAASRAAWVRMRVVIGLVGFFSLNGCASSNSPMSPVPDASSLGAFSISLSVKDLSRSRAFYETLGFRVMGGDGRGYLMMQNGNATIGLFQGMFEGNILTFNPGWNYAAQPVGAFEDVRDIQRRLRESGIALTSAADEASSGPASLVLTDPDGNTILIDQHVPRRSR